MRHRVYGKHLGRNIDQRRALFKGLVYSLFSHGTIQTSEAKAKAIKGLVDKIINSAKDKHNQGQLQSYLTDKAIRERLVEDILPKLGAKTSGYTKLVKMGTRLGDQTRIVKMSLIGAEELKPIKKEVSKPAVKEKEAVPAKKEIVKTAAPKRSVAKKSPSKRKAAK